MTSENKTCRWPLCKCAGVRFDPCPEDTSVKRRGETGLDGRTAQELAESRFEPLIAEIKRAVATLHDAAQSQDPFVYSACVAAAHKAIFTSMRFGRGFLFSWAEENPDDDFHLHSCAAVGLPPEEEFDEGARRCALSLLEHAEAEPGRVVEMRVYERARSKTGNTLQ